MTPSIRLVLFVAAISGGIGVTIGAMGAHSLPTQLAKQGFEPPVVAKKVEQCEIGVRYQMYHALIMAAIGLSAWRSRSRAMTAAIVLFILGTIGFSGGLYLMAFVNQPIHWSIVPIGGTLWIVGWGCLAVAAFRGWHDAQHVSS